MNKILTKYFLLMTLNININSTKNNMKNMSLKGINKLEFVRNYMKNMSKEEIKKVEFIIYNKPLILKNISNNILNHLDYDNIQDNSSNEIIKLQEKLKNHIDEIYELIKGENLIKEKLLHQQDLNLSEHLETIHERITDIQNYKYN
jgi:hypothetical protein